MSARSISPDGRRIAFSRLDSSSGNDLWTLPLDLSDPDRPKPGEPELFLREPGEQANPVFSPDGRWIAYSSLSGTVTQVFVRPFPNTPSAGKWQISTNGGTFPVWSRNGKEIWYFAPDNRVMVVSCIAKGASLAPDKPRLWSPAPIIGAGLVAWNFDLAPDGKRILALPATPMSEGDEKGSVHVTVLLNFFDELKRRLP
ncbi:Serine/threonine protein kinase (fragment) [Candidatus Sulfopaludibacter sp. SbA4]